MNGVIEKPKYIFYTEIASTIHMTVYVIYKEKFILLYEASKLLTQTYECMFVVFRTYYYTYFPSHLN